VIRRSVFIEELRIALYILKDHETIAERIKEKERNTGRTPNLEDLNNNDALNRGTGLVNLNIVSTSYLV
jgi:hypothetical protein